MDTVVRLEGAVEAALEKLIGNGFFKTRAEVIRAGIMVLAKEYGVMPKPGEEASSRGKGGGHTRLAMQDFAKNMKAGK